MRAHRVAAALWLAVPLAAAPSPTTVAPGTTYEWPAGTEVDLLADVPAGARGAFFVEQRAADAHLAATWTGIETPWTVDAPLDFDGVEVLLLPPQVQGPVTLRVTSRGPAGPRAEAPVRERPSHFRVRFEPLSAKRENLPRLQFLGLLTAAGRAWTVGDGEGRRRAAELYDRAAQLGSPDAEDTLLITQAAYAAAVLHRLLGQHEAAYEKARPLVEAWRRHGDRHRLADTWNELGLSLRELGRLDEARDSFEAGFAEATALDDPFRQAFLQGNLCLLDLMQHRLEQGLRCYTEALPRVRRLGDRETESTYLLNMAQVRYTRGEADAAAELYRAALEIQRAEGFEKLEAKTLNNLAGLELRRGELESAIDAYRRAAAIFERLGDGPWHGRSLHNLATVHSRLGDFEAARHHLEAALEIHRRAGYRRGEASALKILGHTELQRGDPEAARRAYEASKALELATDDPAGAAVVDLFLGRLLVRTGHAASALPHLETARTVLAEADKASFLAMTLATRGEALEALGRQAEAATAYREALTLFERIEHPVGRARTLMALAAFEPAGTELEMLAEATSVLDTVTRDLDNTDLRSFFAGAHREVHERFVARLVAAGQVERALEVSESARAWGLRSVLGRTGTGLLGETTPDLDAMRRLLDDGTRLLAFLVGDEASHVFVLGRDTIAAFPLPARAALESRVRDVLEALRGDGPVTGAAELSRTLLADAWPHLHRPDVLRLALVFDGPLHYLPFAALPPPATPESVLAEHFELVRLPSTGVLELERRRRRRRSRAPAPGFAAVLADPIFSTADLRLVDSPAVEPGDGSTTRAPAAGPALPRLRSSEREASAIRRAAAGRSVLVATGLDANRDWLLGQPLADYGILHLATHARIHDTVASRSGLVLAVPAGGSEAGFASLDDLRHLHLRSDLVTLSACSTALGTEIRGEGLVGLVQAFLEAGASRVVASLWPVPDRATAELMERFYQALAEGQAPAAALRRAQLDLRKIPGFEHPSRWAGFVLVGDWQSSVR
jgi:CHAT domain-containing protein/tetratricopeptide (TPR) repeat protein